MKENGLIETESIENTSDPRVFRVRKSYRNQGICFLIIFVLAGIGAAYAVWIDPPPNNKLILISFLSLVWSLMTGLSLWILLGYKYESLTIQNESVIQQGVIFRKEIDLSTIKQARWNLVQGGGIKLKNLTEKISIYFDNFEREEGLWLIQHFQTRLSEDIQQNWDLFCLRVALPLREPKQDPIREPGPGEILITRKRYDRIGIPLIIVSIIGGILTAWYFLNPGLLLAPVLPIGFWLFLRYSTPKQGLVDHRISADKDNYQWLIFNGCWLGLALIGLVISKAIEIPEPQSTITGICLACLWITVLFIRAWKIDRVVHLKNLKKAKAAVQKWNLEIHPQTED